MSLSRLFGKRTESSGECVVFEHSAFFSYLNGFRLEFAVPDAGANFHLLPDCCCDCANDFSAFVQRDAVGPRLRSRSRVFRVFYLREVRKFFDADAATGIEKCKPVFHLSQNVSSAATLWSIPALTVAVTGTNVHRCGGMRSY